MSVPLGELLRVKVQLVNVLNRQTLLLQQDQVRNQLQSLGLLVLEVCILAWGWLSVLVNLHHLVYFVFQKLAISLVQIGLRRQSLEQCAI